MPTEPTLDVLLSRFRSELHALLYPYLIVVVIAKDGSATRQQVQDGIFRLTDGTVAVAEASHNRHIGRLCKTFGVIESVGSAKAAEKQLYQLTAKGQRLYQRTLQEVVSPLRDVFLVE